MRDLHRQAFATVLRLGQQLQIEAQQRLLSSVESKLLEFYQELQQAGWRIDGERVYQVDGKRTATAGPVSFAGYLVRLRKPQVAHIWHSGQDTACKMASTGGLNLSKYTVVSQTGLPVCELCAATALGPGRPPQSS